MPYEFQSTTVGETRIHLWPHRSLPRSGFVWFIGGTAALISVPLVALLGSPVLWGMLPFLVATIASIWWALQRSYADAEIIEDLCLTRETITLTRHGPRGKRHDWQANPHWVRLTLHPNAGPVPNYITLNGNGREVELGAFLSEAERTNLAEQLAKQLQSYR